MPIRIPLGITARNEATNIKLVIESVQMAAIRAKEDVGAEIEIHLILNDNEDNTAEILCNEKDITLWHTIGGLVEAQRMFVDNIQRDAPFVIFSDADILIEENAISEISKTMLKNPELQVVYAEKKPLYPVTCTPLAKALYFYNLRNGYQTQRHYFNGQFFAIRNWSVPKIDELSWDASIDTPFLNLSSGIRCDDIYLSRRILSRYGPDGIRCAKASIWYRPPETLTGMFRKYQRMLLEIERINCYFPETEDTHRKWGRRKIDWQFLFGSPVHEWFLYSLFLFGLALCKVGYRLQRLYYSRFSNKPCTTWLPVVETKERLLQ